MVFTIKRYLLHICPKVIFGSLEMAANIGIGKEVLWQTGGYFKDG